MKNFDYAYAQLSGICTNYGKKYKDSWWENHNIWGLTGIEKASEILGKLMTIKTQVEDKKISSAQGVHRLIVTVGEGKYRTGYKLIEPIVEAVLDICDITDALIKTAAKAEYYKSIKNGIRTEFEYHIAIAQKDFFKNCIQSSKSALLEPEYNSEIPLTTYSVSFG